MSNIPIKWKRVVKRIDIEGDKHAIGTRYMTTIDGITYIVGIQFGSGVCYENNGGTFNKLFEGGSITSLKRDFEYYFSQKD